MFDVSNLLDVDPNWFLSAEIQSVAAMVAIIGAQLVPVGIKRKDEIDETQEKIKRLIEEIEALDNELRESADNIYSDYIFKHLKLNDLFTKLVSGSEVDKETLILEVVKGEKKLSFDGITAELPSLLALLIGYREAGWEGFEPNAFVDRHKDEVFSEAILTKLIEEVRNFRADSVSILSKESLAKIARKHPDILQKSWEKMVAEKEEELNNALYEHKCLVYERAELSEQKKENETHLKSVKSAKSLKWSFGFLVGSILVGIILPSITLVSNSFHPEFAGKLNVINLVLFGVVLVLFLVLLGLMIFKFPKFDNTKAKIG